jgi:F0F1-type ATP synthase assembly protein I
MERVRSWTRITIIQNTMIVVVIVGGMLVGYGIGQYLVDRWINKNNRDINEN